MRFFKKHILLTILLIGLSFYIYFYYTKINNYDKNTHTSDIHFISELYRSSDHIYNNFLGDNEKKMYDHIIKISKRYALSDKINYRDYGCKSPSELGNIISSAVKAIWVDHPELLNFAGYWYSYNSDEFILRLQYAYYLPVNDIIGTLRAENIISEIKEATKDMTDKEKVIYVYDWMGKHNYYDSTFMHDSKNQSIYNVFVRGNAVCAGFAKASHLIFSQIGIESYEVLGYSTGYHMWNIVKCDGEYYYYDSTVSVSADEDQSWHYKGLDQEYLRSFSIENPSWYPEVKKDIQFDINK